MKKPVTEYADGEIAARLELASKLMRGPNGKIYDLPDHLEAERQELLAEQRHRRQCCKLCRWFTPYLEPDDDEPALGNCEWPADRLPHSLRWGNRERTGVTSAEGTTCPTYEEPAP